MKYSKLYENIQRGGAEVGTMEGGRVLISLEPQGCSICVIQKCKFLQVVLTTPILVIIVALLLKSKGKLMKIVIINNLKYFNLRN
jgi:hypothetical protein